MTPLSDWLREVKERCEKANRGIYSALWPIDDLPRAVAEIEKLVEALDEAEKSMEDAVDLISSEYCSHHEKCGESEACYATTQIKALARIRAVRGKEEGR